MFVLQNMSLDLFFMREGLSLNYLIYLKSSSLISLKYNVVDIFFLIFFMFNLFLCGMVRIF